MHLDSLQVHFAVVDGFENGFVLDELALGETACSHFVTDQRFRGQTLFQHGAVGLAHDHDLGQGVTTVSAVQDAQLFLLSITQHGTAQQLSGTA
ncbi:hypothetical protein D1872_281370 [compost metagenome]